MCNVMMRNVKLGDMIGIEIDNNGASSMCRGTVMVMWWQSDKREDKQGLKL